MDRDGNKMSLTEHKMEFEYLKLNYAEEKMDYVKNGNIDT